MTKVQNVPVSDNHRLDFCRQQIICQQIVIRTIAMHPIRQFKFKILFYLIWPKEIKLFYLFSFCLVVCHGHKEGYQL